MRVIRTDKWLLDDYRQPLKIVEKLKDYFPPVPTEFIYDHLLSHGMYHSPAKNGEKQIVAMQEKRIWEIAKQEAIRLQKEWCGPAIPIFILPSDPANRRMQLESNGTAGLAFKDKLFLFVSEHSTERDLQALLTHEYHHIWRLAEYKKEEKDFTLLDSIIMEGLAENAVRERLGDEAAAAWTRYYSGEQLKNLWETDIRPHKDLPKGHPKHERLLYGLRLYPRMAGYCAGYGLVKNYMEKHHLKTKDLIKLPAETIADLSNDG